MPSVHDCRENLFDTAQTGTLVLAYPMPSTLHAICSCVILLANLHANNALRTNITGELLINRGFKCHV